MGFASPYTDKKYDDAVPAAPRAPRSKKTLQMAQQRNVAHVQESSGSAPRKPKQSAQAASAAQIEFVPFKWVAFTGKQLDRLIKILEDGEALIPSDQSIINKLKRVRKQK